MPKVRPLSIRQAIKRFGGMSYIRFGVMILTSRIIMVILMYLNTYASEHVYFSETRTHLALLMGATMAVIMLAFMLGVYSNKTLNPAIFIGAVIVFATSPWLVRSQVAKSDPSYMRAMIPHHSIAVMTSQRAQTKDAVEDALNNSPMSTLDPSPITAEEAAQFVTVQSCHMVYT